MSSVQESSWVRRAQRGDRAAFGCLVDAYWTRLYRWLYGLTHDRHTAEDLTQDAFLKAWSKIDTFQAGTHFRAWVFRIAGNALIDTRRGPRATPPAQLSDTHSASEAGRQAPSTKAVLDMARGAADRPPRRSGSA